MVTFGVIRLAVFTFSIFFTVNVYFLMKKLHQIEFERNKRNMRFIIAFFLITFIVIFIVYISKFFAEVGELMSFQVFWLINYPF